MKKTILVIDDEKTIRNMLAKRLKAHSYRVISADNGCSGLSKALSNKPDLILLDICMPEMDGLSMLRELRKNTVGSTIPVIMLTAHEKMKELFDVDGANDYVVKPYEADELLKKIEKVLS